MTEDLLSVLAELQEAVQETGPHGPGSEAALPDLPAPRAAAPGAGVQSCVVVHVVSCEEDFQQQKLDLLWQKLDDQAPLRQVSQGWWSLRGGQVQGRVAELKLATVSPAMVSWVQGLRHCWLHPPPALMPQPPFSNVFT